MVRPASLQDQIHAAGILVQRLEHTHGWQYSVPAIYCDWHGPYPTEEEAIVAAVTYLIQQVQQHVVNQPNPNPFPQDVSHRDLVGQRKDALQRKLHQLQLEADQSGFAAPPELTMRIEEIKQQLNTLDKQQ